MQEEGLIEYLEGVFGELHFTTIGMMRRAAQVRPDGAAFMEPGRASLDFAGLLRLAERTVGGLNSLGLNPNSRVAIALPNSVEAAAAYRCVLAGMAVLPLSPALPTAEYLLFLRHAKIDAILVADGMSANARAAAAQVGIPAIDVRTDPTAPAGTFELLGVGEPFSAPRYSGPDDLASILHTSGTTSLPKLVPRSQRNLALVSYFGQTQFNDLTNPHPIVSVLALYHSSGFGPLVRCLAGMVAFATVREVNSEASYNLLAETQAPAILVVPSVLQALVGDAGVFRGHVERLRLRLITSVSAALPQAVAEEAARLFGAQIRILYGMTEMNTITLITRSQVPAEKAASVGRPMPFTELKIADEDGTPLPAGETGEIMVRSPLLFPGYADNEEANAESFRDGWFRTGDGGYQDADGYVFLTGRVKEVINRGGSKVSPLDVDEVLEQHPAVVAAATFAFPHSALGEDVAAAVIVSDPAVGERELRVFAARRLHSTKVPSRFVFVDEIPRTPLGKIRRTLLTERFKRELQR